MGHKSVQLAVAIVSRGAGNRAASIFYTYNHEVLLAVKGHDIASSAVMDCLKLDEPEKDLVLGLPSKSDANRLLHAFGRGVEFYKPGYGITFTLSLSGINLAAVDTSSRHEDQTAPSNHTTEHKEDISTTNSHSYELTASVIRTDLSAPIMETARKAGCQGGTLIKAREISIDTGRKLFGVTLSQGKATLLILTPADLRLPVLKAICETAMEETGGHAVTISLPMDAVEGLAG